MRRGQRQLRLGALQRGARVWGAPRRRLASIGSNGRLVNHMQRDILRTPRLREVHWRRARVVGYKVGPPEWKATCCSKHKGSGLTPFKRTTFAHNRKKPMQDSQAHWDEIGDIIVGHLSLAQDTAGGGSELCQVHCEGLVAP